MDIYRFNGKLTYFVMRCLIFCIAFNRKYDDDIPASVKEISSYDSTTGTFKHYPTDKIENYKIVVSTCINAGQLYAMDIQPFTHIFVDEAGQAMEPECLVSISAMMTDNTVSIPFHNKCIILICKQCAYAVCRLWS
jgi:hypothetical protein